MEFEQIATNILHFLFGQVFEQMESFGIKPDPDILRRAREAYLELGIEKKQEELTKKHPLNSKQRRNERRIATRKVLKASNIGVCFISNLLS